MASCSMTPTRPGSRTASRQLGQCASTIACSLRIDRCLFGRLLKRIGELSPAYMAGRLNHCRNIAEGKRAAILQCKIEIWFLALAACNDGTNWQGVENGGSIACTHGCMEASYEVGCTRPKLGRSGHLQVTNDCYDPLALRSTVPTISGYNLRAL